LADKQRVIGKEMIFLPTDYKSVALTN